MEYIELAGKIGAKYVRIMCTNRAMLDDGDYELALSYYKALAKHGEKFGVTPLIETNGMFCDTSLFFCCNASIGSQNRNLQIAKFLNCLVNLLRQWRFAIETSNQ